MINSLIEHTYMQRLTTGIDHNQLESVINRLKNAGGEIREKLSNEIMATALEIETEAKQNAVRFTDLGGIISGIKAIPDNKSLSAKIVVNKHYAPYVEFGTGSTVSIPTGYEDYAAQFKGAGIKKVNLPARPFLFPAYFRNTKEMLKRLKKLC